jgi:c-di-GMP-related signal transduction protein
MATQVLPAASHDDAVASALRYVARQPILDLRGKVHGYELLFRSGPEAIFRGDGDFATQTMIDNSVVFGLEKLTSGLPAFVNCTAETLIKEQVGLLPPSMTVLEILETVKPEPTLIAACRHLKSLGFRLALDDFVWRPSLEPLIQIADYIKIDFLISGEAERREMLGRLSGTPLALIAEKVESQEEYQRARAEGFKLFQGYYFCKPVLFTKRTVPANKLSHLELLRLLQEATLDLLKLSELVKRDASLTYRLLRLVNSPACAVRQEVRSIHPR